MNKVYVNREDKKNLMLELGDPEQFETLDTKLLAALSRIARRDLSRQILTYKEQQAALDKVVRGRQVLLIFEQYFRTNEEAGALYSTEDLLKVVLHGNDLMTFIQNWDSVIAGMKIVPERHVLKDIFLRQIRGCHKIKYDLDTYERAKDGSYDKSYEFLVQAVRDVLTRERLQSNRDRVARAHNQKVGAPAPNANPGRARDPSAVKYCYDFQKGKCTRDNCITSMRKTQDPQAKIRKEKKGRGRSDSQGRDRDRSASRKRAELKKIPCRFFKGGQGKCTRGDNCAFSHETRSAAPATDKPSPKKGASRGRSPTPKGKGRKRSQSKKGESSATVCLRVKETNACLAACRPKQDFWEVDLVNEMVIRHHVMPRKALYDVKNAKDLPVSLECLLDQRITKANINGKEQVFGDFWADPDEGLEQYWTGQTIFICSTDVSNTRRCVKFADNVEMVEIEDAKDKALILEGVVERMQANYKAPCGFYCDYYDDNDPIYCGLYCPGCWIDDDETNLDEVPEYIATPAPAGLHQWIVDTGSEQDLVDTERAVTLQKRINPALTPINLSTANGPICADKIADFSIDQLNEVVTPYVLPSTPAVLSVGQRCLEKGYDFVWRKNSAPYFVRPDGKAVILKLDGRVPYVDDQCEVIDSESAMPVALAASNQKIGGVEEPSSSSGGRPSPDAALFPLKLNRRNRSLIRNWRTTLRLRKLQSQCQSVQKK